MGSGGQRANINVCTLFVRANVWQGHFGVCLAGGTSGFVWRGALRGLFFNDDVAAEPK